jgi:hypothetical protein
LVIVESLHLIRVPVKGGPGSRIKARTGDLDGTEPPPGQGAIQRLVRDALDGLLPEPLSDVLEREAEQRTRVAAVLDVLYE